MEDEGLWFRMPIHAFCHKTPAPQASLYNLVLWDSFSSYIGVTQFDFLINKRMKYIDRNKKWNEGTYLFTLDWAHEDKNIVVENTAKWVLSDDDRYDYEVKEKK